MEIDADGLRKRTKQFALRVIRISQQLPRNRETDVIVRQVLRSATSTAANYRAACRARSHAEFYSKLCIVLEEADESLFWLEMLIESGIVTEAKLRDIVREGNELTAIVAASRSTARKHQSANQQVTQSAN